MTAAARSIAELRPVLAIVLSVAIVVIASGLMTTKVSLDLEIHKASVEATRLVVTGYPVGFILGCLTVRKIVAASGHGIAFLTLIAILICATLTFAVTPDPVAWFLLRVVSGFAMSAIFTIVESWINLDSRADNRGSIFAFYMIMSTLGTATGPALIGLSAADGIGAMIISAAIFLAGAMPLILSRSLKPAQSSGRVASPARHDKPLAVWTLLGLAPAAVIASLQTGMTNMGFAVMGPIYATRIGYGPAEAGALVSVFALGGLVAQGPVGWFSDRAPRHKVLAAVAFMAALTCGLIVAFAHVSAAILFGLVFLLGCTALSIYPLAVALAGARVEPDFLVSLSSRLLLIYGIGSIVAPALSNELMNRFGPAALFCVLGTAIMAVAVAGLLNDRISTRMMERKP